VISCELELEPVDVVEFDQAQFDRERAAWDASNVKNYRFDMYVEGMGQYSIIRFVVENGVFKEREIIESGKHDSFYQNGFTIAAFYAQIEQTVQTAWEDYGGRDPDEMRYLIDVVYNTDHHYPVSIYARELYFGSNLAGDRIIYSIKNFVRLN
jgi:hypothetical protein